MSRRQNNRFFTSNKNVDSQQSNVRKCTHHIGSYNYATNMRQHDNIVQNANGIIQIADTETGFNIIIALHFLAPNNTYNTDRVNSRAHDIVQSINDDFNNYSSNPNTMNNFRYKSIVNQVFSSNMTKQRRYLSPEYLKLLPTKPSNITFELGDIYFYPVKNRLSLGQYHDNNFGYY